MKRHAPEEPDDDGGPLYARARRTDPGTSHAAAASIAAERIKGLRKLVLEALRSAGPMDDTRLVAWITERMQHGEFSESGIRTRRSELVAAGKIEDSGERVNLDSGRMAIVWRVKL